MNVVTMTINIQTSHEFGIFSRSVSGFRLSQPRPAGNIGPNLRREMTNDVDMRVASFSNTSDFVMTYNG